MKPLAVVLALAQAAPPGEAVASAGVEVSPGTAAEPSAPVEEPPVVMAPLSGSGEGPSPPPDVDLAPRSGTEKPLVVDPGDPNDWWHRRDRRLRDAAIGLGGVAALAFVGGGMFFYASNERPLPAGALDDAGFGSMGVGIVATLAMIGVGVGLGVTRRRGWQPPPAPYVERPSFARLHDPRLDPEWVKTDRTLRGATIGLGALSGLVAISIPLTFRFVERSGGVADCNEPTGCSTVSITIPRRGLIVTGEILALSASVVALVVVGAQWSAHRQPLRRWKLAPTAGGLQIQF